MKSYVVSETEGFMFVCRRSYPDHEKTVFGKMDLFPGLFLPGLSTVKNVVDIFAKYVWKPNPVSLSGWRATYYKHITEKSVGRCIFLVIPVLGPIAVLLAEFLEESYIDSLKEKVKEGDIDAIKKLCKEPDTAKERKEALEGLFSKATFSEEERKLVIEMGAACSTVKDTSPLQKTALSGVKETICEWFAKEMLEPWWQMEDLVSLYEYLDKLNRDVNLSWDSSCDEDVHPMAVALRPHILTCVKDKLDSFGLDEVVKWYRASILPEKLKTCAFTVAVRKWIDSSGPENANEADAVCRLYTSDVTDREAIFVFATKEAEGGSLKALDRLWLLMRLTRQLKFPLQEAKLFRWFREVAKKPSAPLQRAAMDRILFFVCTRDVTVDVEYTFSAMLVVDFAIFSTKDKEYLVSKLIGLAKDNRGRKFLSWLEALAEQDQRCVLIAKALAKVYQEYGEKAQTFFLE
jgi:hypothetical protein